MTIVQYSEKNIDDGQKNIKVKGTGEDNNNNERLYLDIEIMSNNSNKSLIVIMLNPSESGMNKEGIFVDKTTTNLIKIANENNYNKIKVFNLLTEKEPDSKKVNYSNFNKDNFARILKAINNNSNDILLAWGAKYKNNTKNLQVKKLLNILRQRENVFTFCANPNLAFPKHPGRINIDCCRNCYGRKNKIEFKQYFS